MQLNFAYFTNMLQEPVFLYFSRHEETPLHFHYINDQCLSNFACIPYSLSVLYKNSSLQNTLSSSIIRYTTMFMFYDVLIFFSYTHIKNFEKLKLPDLESLIKS